MKKNSKGLSSGRLRRALFVYLAAALLILSTLLSVSIITPLYSRLKLSENRSLAHTAEMMSMTIFEWGKRARDVALQITSRTLIRQELERYNRGEVTFEEVRSFTTPKLEDAMIQSREIVGIQRLNKDNRVIAQCGLPFKSSDWPKLNFSEESVVNPIPVKIKGGLAVVVGARIKDREGRHVGTDMVMISLKYLKNIIKEKAKLRKSERIVLGYQYNNRVYSVLPVFRVHSRTHDTVLIDRSVWAVLKNAIIGNSGVIQSGDVVMAYSPVKGWNWGLLVSQSEGELYSSLNMVLALVVLMSLGIFLVCLLGFRLMLRPLSSRILLNTEELEHIIDEKTEQINASLKEKEILIREIHHRVKNNLSVVAGLLGLQAENAVDPGLKTVLYDSQNRVHSMSAIHEALYESDDQASVELKSYLWNLAGTITRSYEIKSNVKLNIDAESLHVNTEQATPIGLIINELISNTLKYAFQDDRAGEISIRLKKSGDEIELEYADNGPGIPSDFDWENTRSLGLKLVKMLAENQLKGSFQYDDSDGARFVMRFMISA